MVLDPEAKPFKYESIKVELCNEGNRTITITNEQRTSNFSVITGKYKLGDEPTMGEWKIQVQVNSVAPPTVKSFFVAKESKKFIKIFVNGPNAISSHDSEVSLNIYAKNSLERIVEGTVFIEATIFNDGGSLIETSKKLYVSGTESKISFNLEDDFGVRRVLQNYKIKFKLSLTYQGISYEAEKDVRVVNGGRHYIVPELSHYFLAGMSYNFKAKVYTVNGDLEDRRGMQVIARAKFDNSPNKEHSDSAILKNGVVEFNLPTFENANTMTLSLEIVNFKVEKKIYAQSDNARILQVTVFNSK